MMPYLDTSALAKLYLNEPGSQEFSDYLQTCERPRISTLVVVEMRSLLERHRRAGSVDAEYAADAFDLLLSDIDEERLVRIGVRDEDLWSAAHLMGQVPEVALRTLDAIHLAVCQRFAIRHLATADERMAQAARSLAMEVVTF